MNTELLNYFINLDKIPDTRKKKHTLIIDDKTPTLNTDDCMNFRVKKYLISTTPCYAKKYINTTSLMTMGISRMYNHVGVATPIISVAKEANNYMTLSQDIEDIEKHSTLDVIQSYRIKTPQQNKTNIGPSSKWATINDKEYIEELLHTMTPEFIDYYNTITLLEELVTHTDGHSGNKFYYKSKDAKKYEGIIPFDLDFYSITASGNPKFSEDDFNKFIWEKKYSSSTLQSKKDEAQTFVHRSVEIKRLLCDGKLSSANISALKNALSFDLPKTIKTLGKEHKLPDRKNAYEIISMLWEYNITNLRDDLSL